MALLVLLGHKVYKVSKVLLVLSAQLDLKDKLDLSAQLDLKENKVFKVQEDI